MVSREVRAPPGPASTTSAAWGTDQDLEVASQPGLSAVSDRSQQVVRPASYPADMVRTGPATRRFTGYAGLAAMLMLAFWLGGAANAWMAMGAAQRAAVSVRGWRRSQQRRGGPRSMLGAGIAG